MPSNGYDLSEKLTRERIIDPQLRRVGWNKAYIKSEINPVKSDFSKNEFISNVKNIQKGIDLFIDYLLLSEDNKPLAIIEAKRYSKDPEIGRIQSRTYVKKIEEQIGFPIPIFLTNGEKWKIIDEFGIERKISGPFSQTDLKRRHELYLNRKDITQLKINQRIVDRPKSVYIVRKLSEHFALHNRSALVQMATGTGKTRVAMAIIDLFNKANYVRNVLFITDRTALTNQAISEGFKQFFTEPIHDIRVGFSTSARLYASTVQTLMSGDLEKTFMKYSPSFFDLIIFDEAHRSYYDKNDLIFAYFDALKIGLTATPTDFEGRDTYQLFDCESNQPTVEYSYEDAIRDKILVPYQGEIIDTKILTLGIKSHELSPELEDQLRKQEENPELVDYSGSDFDRVFMDNKTNLLIIRRFMERCLKSDDGKPAKSIFFCASQNHAKNIKSVFNDNYPFMSNDVQVITSDMYRSHDEVKRFKNRSNPRVALSVGMLDTGVNIPELCNLVFIKPIYSSVRFWQMLGRGTRNFNTCKNIAWLPNKEKNYFLILDFKIGRHSNIEYHKLNASSYKKRIDVMVKIFINRVKLLDKNLNETDRNLIVSKIIEDINSLNENIYTVREKSFLINTIKSNKFNLSDYIKELEEEIAPLMILKKGTNSYVTTFVLNCEKLFSLILDDNKEQIYKIREIYVQPIVENIYMKNNINEIIENSKYIKMVLQDHFWDDLTFQDVEILIRYIAPLVKYYSPDSKKVIQIDALDIIVDIEEFELELKEDTRFKELIKSNPLIKKLRQGDGLTSAELKELEAIFQEIRPEISISNIKNNIGPDLMAFIRE